MLVRGHSPGVGLQGMPLMDCANVVVLPLKLTFTGIGSAHCNADIDDPDVLRSHHLSQRALQSADVCLYTRGLLLLKRVAVDPPHGPATLHVAGMIGALGRLCLPLQPPAVPFGASGGRTPRAHVGAGRLLGRLGCSALRGAPSTASCRNLAKHGERG